MNFASSVSAIPRRLANSFSVPTISRAASSNLAAVEFTPLKRQVSAFGLVFRSRSEIRAPLSHPSVMGTSLATREPDAASAMARKPKTAAPTGVPGPAPRAPAAQLALLGKLAEIERLVRPPLLPSQLERAHSLALSIARNAPDGVIAMLGTRL